MSTRNKRQIPKCDNGRTYETGCRCTFCRKQVAAGQAAYRYRQMQRARGVEYAMDLVDAREARRIVRLAQRRGIGYREMARLTGLTRNTLQLIEKGKSKRVQRSTRDIILHELSVKENRHVLPNTMVDPKWTQQMIRSLAAQGWSKAHLQEILRKNINVNGGFLYTQTASPAPAKVSEKNRQAMLWLTEAIGNKIGPQQIVARSMQKRGHFPVKHYDYQGNLMVQTLSPEQRAMYESV